MTAGVQLQLNLGLPPTPAELRKAAANEWAHDVWREEDKEVPYGASVLFRLRSRTVAQLRRYISQERNHTLDPSLRAEIRRLTRGVFFRVQARPSGPGLARPVGEAAAPRFVKRNN